MLGFELPQFPMDELVGGQREDGSECHRLKYVKTLGHICLIVCFKGMFPNTTFRKQYFPGQLQNCLLATVPQIALWALESWLPARVSWVLPYSIVFLCMKIYCEQTMGPPSGGTAQKMLIGFCRAGLSWASFFNRQSFFLQIYWNINLHDKDYTLRMMISSHNPQNGNDHWQAFFFRFP